MEIIGAEMGMGEDLKNVSDIICLRSVSGVIIFGLGTKGSVEGGNRCLTYVEKDLMNVHLPRRPFPA